MDFRSPRTQKEWEDYYDLRYRILRAPLGKERGSERNDGDESGLHFALFDKKLIVGIARLDRLDEVTSQVRFVAIEKTKQGTGLGKKLMTSIENEATALGHARMILHARDYALPFYLNLGYENHGESYKLFDVLQHFEMSKELKGNGNS